MIILGIFAATAVAVVVMAIVIDRSGGSVSDTGTRAFGGSTDHDLEASRGQGRGLGDGAGGFEG